MSIRPPTSFAFQLFPNLPTELRLNIWSFNLPPPRLVPVHYLSSSTPPTTPLRYQRGCTSPTPIPVNLHTCHESRQQALAAYVLSFNLPHCPPKIFFSPFHDILYYGPKDESYMSSFKNFVNSISLISPSELLKVRKLAVHEALFVGLRNGGSRENFSVTASCLRQFWEYVQRKFRAVDEVAFFATCTVSSEVQFEQEQVMGRGMLPTPPESGPSTPCFGTFLNEEDQGKEGHFAKPTTAPSIPYYGGSSEQFYYESEEENLSWKIEHALQSLVEEGREWRVPSWRVVLVSEGMRGRGVVEEVDLRDVEDWGRVERRVVVKSEDSRFEDDF
ncbi:hypothetical protein G7Y89_g5244 [Cudoniella acicularis]|uniref:2EXR domain-containing protein n=1 Tax=Cudoniella acicularis TaxID=354080 RepID=A0A8H4RQ30_9HELO|nr:hypothetical protein G7Y89_g5244 [Cudoniella acicularis]